jgi:hypothetical protein
MSELFRSEVAVGLGVALAALSDSIADWLVRILA